MATSLNNIAVVNGRYNDEAFEPLSSNVMVELVEITVTKNAAPRRWAGGALTYAVNVTNGDADLPLTDLVLTDTLDPTLVTLVENSVEINGVAAADVTYDEISGLLTVGVPDIAAGATTDITFRVTKK